MHWWQGAFASASKSHSDDDSVFVGSDGRYSLKPSFLSSGRSRHLARARRFRHAAENDEMWRSPSQSTHSRSPSASPQPLPMPELQVLLRRDPKFAASSSIGVPLPSPRDVIQNQRGYEKEIGRSREREAAEGLDADAIDGLNGLKRLAGQDTTDSILSDIRSSRKSPQKLKVKDRSSNIYSISIPMSAPTSPYSSPVRSPPRSDMFANHYITPPSIFQVWSAPEIPHADRNPVLGFFYPQLASEKAASSVDNSPLQSPRLSSHVYGTSPPMTTSPLPTKMAHESSLAPWESNAQATVHPLPLPPRAVNPSYPASLSPVPAAKSDFSGASMPSHPTPISPLAIKPEVSVAVISSRSSLVSPLAAKPELLPIKQQWQKGKLIGRGTFGSVYVASNRETGALCAMKEVEILPDDAKSAECIRQLEQEIKVLSHLKHPNIVQYFGSEIVGEKFYIYLEYVHPGSINRFIHDHCGAITESVVRNFTRHILCGLAYLHSKKTIHRDIKGANLLVDAYGVVKLADFGMAKHLSGQAANLSMRGSPYWMAPELLNFGMQKDANSDLALAVDIWSLGCTIIEMLNGKPPWSEYEGAAALFKVIKETPPIPETLSADGKDFLSRCFRRNPADRPTASKLLDHPFVNYSQQPEAFSQTWKERKLMNDMQFLRERLNQKSDSVPVSFGSQIKMAKVSNNVTGQRSHHRTPQLAVVPLVSPRSTLESFPTLSPPSMGQYSNNPTTTANLPSSVKQGAGI